MEYPFRRFVVTLFAAFVLMSSPAFAADPAAVVEALRQSPVYVQPGTEGTNSDTAGVLLRQIQEGDYVVIVMLPADASLDTDEELQALARQIDESLGGQTIIGLSAGDQVIAYSAILPAGEASDQMQRATTVSTNTSETMSTFIRNIHSLQVRIPEVVQLPPGSSPVQTGSVPLAPIGFGFGLLGAIILAIALVAQRRRAKRLRNPVDSVKLKSAPNEVRDVLNQILKLRERITSREVRDILTLICQDTEAYFSRNSTREGVPLRDDAEVFEDHLESLRNVVERYIDVQDNPRYFEQPKQLMEQGEDALNGFMEFALNNVRRGSRKELTSYTVDTKILSAQRHA